MNVVIVVKIMLRSEIYNLDFSDYITKHFKVSEFYKDKETYYKYRESIFNIYKLVVNLQKVRLFVGPVVVLSGFRDFYHNQSVGGAKFSYHLQGLASDIYFNGISHGWFNFFQDYFNGVIWYREKNFFHVDLGDRIDRPYYKIQ